jgi:transcriptional regulator with XRE-family HTH domain
METMGDRIKFHREAKGLSQLDLAKICGVTKGAVSQWELGRSKNVKNEPWLKLVEALGVSGDYLVHGAGRGARGKPPTGALDSKNSPT